MSGAREYGADYYAANYRNYARQNPARKLDFYTKLVRGALKNPDHAEVLDVGCAFGAFLGQLPDTWDRFGVDMSAFALATARAQIPAGHFVVSSATHLPFSRTFDAVTAFDVLEHVPDLNAAAKTISAHLRPGGALVFVVPVYDGPTGPIIHALDGDPTHVHKTGRNFWLDWAQRHFTLESWCGVYRYLLPAGQYVHLPTTRLRRVTPAIAVVAHKAET